jgi:hypothetical protein
LLQQEELALLLVVLLVELPVLQSQPEPEQKTGQPQRPLVAQTYQGLYKPELQPVFRQPWAE